jgi:hypothetical protein
MLKAGSATGIDNPQPADKAYHTVAATLTAVTASPSAGLSGEFTAAVWAPWLAISGRVMLYTAARLAGAAAGDIPAGTTAEAPTDARNSPPDNQASTNEVTDVPNLYVAECCLDEMPQPHELLTVSVFLCRNLRTLLQLVPLCQQLQAAGYDVKGIQQQLDAFLQLLPDNVTSLNSEQSAALQSLGSALTRVAFPCACNNPACSQLAGPLELQLVNGRSCMCAGCRVAHYCCRDCQRRHWKQHKPVCQAIAAAQAATATAQSAGADASS